MALTKNDIVEQIQSGLSFPKNQSKEITETLLEIMKSAMESGDDVLVSGFGRFCVKDKKERKGRNPATSDSRPYKPNQVPLSVKNATSGGESILGKPNAVLVKPDRRFQIIHTQRDHTDSWVHRFPLYFSHLSQDFILISPRSCR
jgi:integration host factor subunit alpha